MMNHNEMTDEQLAIAYMKGDDKAFDMLLARNQKKLYSYIMFVVRDTNIADDVFQETFVKVITRLRTGAYTTSGKFSAWLTRIAHNVIIDMFRSQRHDNLVEPTVDNDLTNILCSDMTYDNIESQLVLDQNLKDAKRLMEALPPTQREVVFMRFYQQMSFKEIAEVTGQSINTALGRMRYAVLNMRRMANTYQMAI